MMDDATAQALIAESVLKPSTFDSTGAKKVEGYDFNKGVNYKEILKTYYTTGFQATNFSKAVIEIERMIECKLKPIPEESLDKARLCPTGREPSNCNIFFGFTSNMISSGLRTTIRYLAQHNLVDCMVVTAGGVEEDFIKCMAPTYLGSFDLVGTDLRSNGINRIGNLVVPNENYCMFEEWLTPILDEMLKEQNEEGINWTPSKFIHRLGKEIDNEESVYYWAYRNNIPVFSPAITDGSIGDILFSHTFKNSGLKLDIVEDIRRINLQSMHSVNSGMVILGGGLVKHHICNANLMRNGADYSVYLNTGQAFEGSDSGAPPDEAVSWGKIRQTAQPVKVFAEATLVFPLLMGETFAKYELNYKKREEPAAQQPAKRTKSHVDC